MKEVIFTAAPALAYLVSNLVSDDRTDPLFLRLGAGLLVVEQCTLTVRDQTPVLHGSGVEIRQCDLICER